LTGLLKGLYLSEQIIIKKLACDWRL